MSDERQPPVWSQPTQYIVTILLFVAGVALVIFTRELIASLVIAAILTYILNPIARSLRERVGLSQRTAALVTYLVFIVALVAVLATSTTVAIDRMTTLTQDLDSLVSDVEEGLADNAEIFGVNLPIDEWLNSIDLTSALTALPTRILGVISNLSTNLIWVLVVFVTVFYLLQDWHKLRDWAIQQMPPGRRDDFVRLYFEIKLVWQAYLRGQLVLMIVVGLFSGIGCAIFGLRGALFIGLLAGILDVVPSVGPAIAAVVGIIVAWVTGSTYLPVSNTVFAIIILGVFSVVQAIENVWWRPRIMGSSLRIHPAIVFVGVMSSLALAGVFVTLIIVPLLGTVGVLWYYLRARMLGIDPWLEQRLDVEAMQTLAEVAGSQLQQQQQAATLEQKGKLAPAKANPTVAGDVRKVV